MTGLARLFMAVTLDADAAQALAPLDRWLRKLPRHRLTPPHLRHLTAGFIGEVDAGLVPELAAAMDGVCRGRRAIEAPLGPLIALPSSAKPRVLAVALEEAEGLIELLTALKEAAAGVALTEGLLRDLERNATPHITVARSRGSGRPEQVDVSRAPRPVGHLRIKQVNLVRSTLTPAGPVYETLTESELGGDSV